MADLATKSDAAESQREGTRVVDVTEKGTVAKHGGRDIAADAGIAIANTRWGNRSMGNGGVIGA